ncbi:hypothetical protein, partial [Paucihalobacter sp.]|uniref:hypothetical protein n=1 Tax=Paucihalobacter sp. TaxID=2850405 RepID=UPI002FE130FE
LLLTQCLFSQKHNFDCYNLSKSKIMSKFQDYKNYGLKLTRNDIDVMEFTIDELRNDVITQLCINAWYEVRENGSEYTYEKFKRRNADLSYKLYLADIQFFEILSAIKNQLILKN